jgi:serine carboxypeptidase-like clade 4
MIKLTLILLLASLALASDCPKPKHDPIFLNETYHTGFVKLKNNRGSLFYWLFESRKSPSTDPLVLVLNHGIGLTSQVAIFFENGPYRLNPDNITLHTNPYSWTNIANVLFVDAPLGTGFSYISAPAYDINVAVQDLLYFLQQFLVQHSNFAGRDFYVASQSYGSHPITRLSNLILKNPKNLKLNLKGYILGGPLIYPGLQYSTWFQYAAENGLISNSLAQELAKEYAPAQELLSHLDSITDLNDGSNEALSLLYYNITGWPPAYNPLNIKEGCNVDSQDMLCMDYTTGLKAFMMQPKVLKAIGVTDASQWTVLSQNTWVDDTILDYAGNYLETLGELVQSGIPGVIYCGGNDLIWDCIGSELAVNSIKWNGQKKFAKLKHTVWGKIGEYKHLDNLTFMEVYNAGHFSSKDQPQSTLAILKRLIEGGKW